MAVPDKAQTVPAIKEQSANSRKPGTARACTSTAVRDAGALFVVLLRKLGTIRAKFQLMCFVIFFRSKCPWVACYVMFMPFLMA